MLFERTTELPSEQHQGLQSCTAQYKHRENKSHKTSINLDDRNPEDKTMYTSQMLSHLKERESPFCSQPPLADNVHHYKEIDNSGIRPPAHPQFALLCNRLRTFNSWPRNLHQKPNDLAAAGFFYPGTADIVTCFSCGGSLKEWEPEDDPLIEHAHWFPSCSFLLQTKGENFIRQAQLKNQDDDAIEKTDNYNAADNVACCEPQTQSPPLLKTNTKNDTIDVVLETPAAQSVMMMGYTREITKQAIEKCLHAGKSKPSAVDIMQILFDMEEEEESENDEDEKVPTETENIKGETGNRYQSTLEGGDEENNNTYSQCTEEPLTANTVYRSLSPVSACDLPRPIEENLKSLSIQQEPIPQSFSQLELNQMNDLMEENRKLRESNKCKVCLDKDSNTVFLPCGHLATCAECATSLIKCPLCRQHIHGTVRVYLA